MNRPFRPKSRLERHNSVSFQDEPGTSDIAPARGRHRADASSPARQPRRPFLGLAFPVLWSLSDHDGGSAEAGQRQKCHITSLSECPQYRRAPLRSLQLALSAQSHQTVFPIRSTKIARAGQQRMCHITSLSECQRDRGRSSQSLHFASSAQSQLRPHGHRSATTPPRCFLGPNPIPLRPESPPQVSHPP
jgi:hypothetical protein